MSTTSKVSGNEKPLSVPGLSSQPQIKPPKPNAGDSISSSSSTTSNDGCLAKLWKTICNFFKCICPCLFGAKPSALEQAQTELLMWGNQKDSTGKLKNLHGDIDETLAMKVQSAACATGCPQQEIILHYQSYNHGFSFFYAQIAGTNEYLPIARDVGRLLQSACLKNIPLPWAITHPRTGQQVITQVKERQFHVPWPYNNSLTDQLLNKWLKEAQSNDQSTEFRILESLIPYAYSVKEALSDSGYAQLRKLFPGYPEHPVAPS